MARLMGKTVWSRSAAEKRPSRHGVHRALQNQVRELSLQEEEALAYDRCGFYFVVRKVQGAMRTKLSLRFFIAGLGLVTVFLAVIAGAIASNNHIKYRAIIIFNKATGQLDEIGWFDLLEYLKPHSSLDLGRLA